MDTLHGETAPALSAVPAPAGASGSSLVRKLPVVIEELLTASSADATPESVAGAILRAFLGLTDTQGGSVWMHDVPGWLGALEPPTPAHLNPVMPPDRPDIVYGGLDGEQWGEDAWRTQWLASGYKWALVVPLIYAGRRVGVVALGHKRRIAMAIETHDLSLLAAQAALMLDHARLVQQAHMDEPDGVEATGTKVATLPARSVAELLSAGDAGWLRELLNGLPCAVVVVSRDRQVLVSNRAAELLGHQESPTVRRWPLFRATGQAVPDAETPLSRALLGGETVIGEQALIGQPDGPPLRVLVGAAPLHDASGTRVAAMGVYLDGSHLTELNRLKDEFLAMLRHELNTPVTGVRGFIQLAQRRIGQASNDYVRDVLAQAGRSAERLSTLIDVLLDVSRLQTGLSELRRDEVDMGRLLLRVAESLQVTTRLHRLEVRTTAEPLCVIGDAARLEEVLVSLTTNAIKYTPRGGAIALSAQRDDNQITVSVQDAGIGIALAEQAHVFEPFYRGQNAVVDPQGGLGMGLHISKKIIEWHGGKMWVDSLEDEGSTFYFSVPKCPAPTHAFSSPATADEEARRGQLGVRALPR